MAYIGRQLARGENKLFDDISSSFNGSTTTFNLTVSSVATATATPYQLFVSLGGVMQKPNTDFTTAGNQITFTTAPAAGLSCWIMMQGDTINQAAISDASVTPSKISGTNFAFSGDLRLKDADGSHYVGFASPTTVASNKVWTLPAADGSASQYLQTNGSGVLSWATVSIGGGTGIDFNDNVKARWGTGNDLEIFHNSSNSVINDAGTGDLLLQVGGATKATVSSTGFGVTGALTVSTNATISGNLTVSGTTTTVDSVTLSVKDKNIEMGVVSSPSDTTADGGGITLKGASDKTFNWVDSTDAWTSSEHIHLGDNKKLLVGTGSDLSLYHDGTNSYIDNREGNLVLMANTTDVGIKIIPDASCELYENNVKRAETTTNGFNVIGSLLVDGSPLSTAPTITGTASGAIAAHKPCIVHTDGTFKQVVATVTPQTPAGVASTSASAIDGQAINTSTAQTGMAIAHDPVNDNFGFLWRQSNNIYFKMAKRTTAGAVDLTTSGTGGALTVQTGHTPTICFDSTKEQFVAFNTLQTDSTQVAKGYGYTNSDKNVMEEKWSLTIRGNQCQTPHIIFHPGINKPILVFRDIYDSKTYATIITIASDGNSATGSSACELSGSSTNTVYMREVAGILYDPDRTDKLYIGTMMDHTNALKCVTLTVASTSLTRAGDDEVVGGGSSDKVAQKIAGFVHDSNTGKDILLYKQNSDGLFYGKVATTSDTGISVSSKTALTSGTDSIGSATAVYDETLEKIVVIFQDEGDSNKGKAFAIDTSGTNPSAGTVSNALTNGNTDVGANNFVSDAVYDSKTKNVVWTGTDAGNNTWPRWWNLKSAVQTTNVTTENFIGFADAAYSNSATATVNVVGNTTTQSSLTAGQKYFVTATGALSTTADIPSVEAGLALSATKLLIKPA